MDMDARHHHVHLHTYLAAAIFVAFAPALLAAGDPLPLGHLCGSSGGNFSLNDDDTYQANILRLSATLPKSTSSSPKLFATVKLGSVPDDIVYALALCRGDTTNASACSDCVTAAFEAAQQLCAHNKDATVFYGTCLLRYSNKDFIASSATGTVLILVNAQNVTAPFKVFDAAVATLLNTTADYAASNSSKRFGMAERAFRISGSSNNPTIYGSAQCTPDMSPTECRSCLSTIIQVGTKYFSGKQGGRILGLRCNYRYELQYSFSSTRLLQLPEHAVRAPARTPAHSPVNGMPPTTGGGGRGGNKTGRILVIALPTCAGVLATVVICFCLWRRKRKTAGTPTLPEDIHIIDSLITDLSTLRTATENFDEANKLGEGGFGAVYKGILPDNQEIAVKRLSQSSKQGVEEMKNELVLVAKLRHKNLVRLVGVSLQDHEKLLVYEYMPNKSLDSILFDPERCGKLDWENRFKIINGIARGLPYLHEESQLKIIHRDLKASNVLLDYDFNPKISDFGLARLFQNDQTHDVTNRVVGTYGYMAPEYLMRGNYSVKSDMFSFGVLILEIVTGRRNGDSYSTDQSADLLNLVWEHWTTGTLIEILDSSLRSFAARDQMLKCIHIGLLCVQENPTERPMMSTVNIMLSSSTVTLQAPSRPTFSIPKSGFSSDMSLEGYPGASHSASRSTMWINDISVTELDPRSGESSQDF